MINNSDTILGFHYSNVLFKKNVKPDTDKYWFRVDWDYKGYFKDNQMATDTGFIMLTAEEHAKAVDENGENIYLPFMYPVYTVEYGMKCAEIVKNFERAKNNADEIRLNDSQYEDPSEWYAEDALKEIVDDNLYNRIINSDFY